MRTILHNTVPTGFKIYLSVGSDYTNFIVSRKRYEYKIGNVIFKLPKKFTVLDYLKNLYTIVTVDLENISEGKNKEILTQLKPDAIKLYNELGFSYSTFILFRNSIRIVNLS